jgi:hypothetical protein
MAQPVGNAGLQPFRPSEASKEKAGQKAGQGEVGLTRKAVSRNYRYGFSRKRMRQAKMIVQAIER